MRFLRDYWAHVIILGTIGVAIMILGFSSSQNKESSRRCANKGGVWLVREQMCVKGQLIDIKE